jgi:asparagine synthase (glutamine-hydrolysing)
LARSPAEGNSVARGNWFDPVATTRLLERRFENLARLEPLRQFMEMDRHLWLVDESLRLADAVTMASGLECRVPFLDPRIIAFSLATPAKWHIGTRRTKAFLKDTYRQILPDHLFSLSKSSFYPPLAKWLRRESGPLVEEMLAGKRIKEYFDTAVLRRIFEEHRRRERYGLHTLSSLIQLHQWFETVYDSNN